MFGRDVGQVRRGNLAGSGRADFGRDKEGWMRALEKEKQE